jgi:cytochrome c-type biogenesis protein CcmH/NrfG
MRQGRRALGRIGGVVWPLALLVAFAGVFHGGPATSDGGRPDADCESTPTADIALLERCLAHDSRNVRVMHDLAGAFEATGRVDEAEALYRRTLSIDPQDGESRLRLAAFLLRRGRVDDARVEARRALEVRPHSPAATHITAEASGRVAVGIPR